MFSSKQLIITKHAKERFQERSFNKDKKGVSVSILKDLTNSRNIRKIDYKPDGVMHIYCHGARRYIVKKKGSKYIVLSMVQHIRKSNKYALIK